MLRDARLAARSTQERSAGIAGLSQSTWSLLERGGDGRVTLATWSRAAMAVGSGVEIYLRRASGADRPRDSVHLRHQELVIGTAAAGGWRALPEEPIDREARTSRAADVILQRRKEYAIVEVWDWFEDVGAALRDFDRRRDALARFAIARMRNDELPLTGGCWVVRATRRNRLLVQEHRHVFRARFPGSGVAWLSAFAEPGEMIPAESALLWVTVSGDRLYPARLG